MPPSTSALLPWIDKALAANGHPSVAEIVAAGRSQVPPVSWDKLAGEIQEKAGGQVNSETLRLNFSGTAE